MFHRMLGFLLEQPELVLLELLLELLVLLLHGLVELELELELLPLVQVLSDRLFCV